MYIRVSKEKLIPHIDRIIIQQETIIHSHYLDIVQESRERRKKLLWFILPDPLKYYQETFSWHQLNHTLKRMKDLREVAEIAEDFVSLSSDDAILLKIKKDTF